MLYVFIWFGSYAIIKHFLLTISLEAFILNRSVLQLSHMPTETVILTHFYSYLLLPSDTLQSTTSSELKANPNSPLL